ncbi:aldehyde dehydrogenase [Trametopsis cervina]|nr:aldehyde dehydrogenase [Trametopsis cervina]
MSQTQLPTVPLFINGKEQVPKNAATYEVRNPATGEVVAHTVAASAEDCNAAIEAAQAAFPAWAATPPGAKAKIFRRAKEVIASPELRAKIVETAHNETGVAKQWAGVLNSITDTVFDEAADTVYHLRGEILPSDTGSQAALVQVVPMGVIFIISPWNAPLLLALSTCLPAIAAGNAVVLKTSEYSPASQLITAHILKEAGLPDGVFNVIHTSREDSGPRTSQIIAHPSVRKIGFTGSDRVGKILAAEAAKHLKPCVFELGGKAPAIVLNDADIDAAARGIVSGAVINSGQACIGTERVIVQRTVSAALIAGIKSVMSAIYAGDTNTDPSARLSCLFNPASAQNVVGMVKEAIEAGAELVVGDLEAKGAFVQPHVVLGAKPGTRLWDRESFGPVLTISVVDTVAEAVALANTSTYSLTSSLWTSDVGAALALAPQIRAGKVIVNNTTLSHEVRFHQTGLGGSSGYGSFAPEEFVFKQLVSFYKTGGQKFLITDI